MADDRYGDSWRGGGRGRSSSIFSDDDEDRLRRGGRDERWSGSNDRGFIERAGDEVRSWLGDEEAERRREMDSRRGERPSGREDRSSGWASRSAYGERSGGSSGFGGERNRSTRRDREGHDDRSRFPGGHSATSHFDENYRRWRDQQIAELDREYEDYCRERQQRFESDFDSWRQGRKSRSGEQAAVSGGTGRSGESVRSDASASGTTGLIGSQPASATTAGGGEASAVESSTGSGPEGDAASRGRGRS